jgi:hypothetical protein
VLCAEASTVDETEVDVDETEVDVDETRRRRDPSARGASEGSVIPAVVMMLVLECVVVAEEKSDIFTWTHNTDGRLTTAYSICRRWTYRWDEDTRAGVTEHLDGECISRKIT